MNLPGQPGRFGRNLPGAENLDPNLPGADLAGAGPEISRVQEKNPKIPPGRIPENNPRDFKIDKEIQF